MAESDSATIFVPIRGVILALLLTEDDVRALLPLSRALDLVQEGFRLQGVGEAKTQPRRRIRFPGGIFHCMEAALQPQQIVGLKAYASTQARTTFVVLLFSTSSSELLAMIEADWLGRIRTGAASGVATRILAAPKSRIGAVIGAGSQSGMQIEALSLARDLEVIKVFSRNSERREELVKRMAGRIRCRLQTVSSVEEAIRHSDVVTTITTASQPVFDGSWLKSGAHVNAAGSNRADRQEIDERTVERAGLVVVDSLEQARAESGDLLHAERGGVFRWDGAREFADIVSGNAAGRSSSDDVTLYESQGVALQDVVVAQYVYHQALQEGRGHRIPFGRAT